MQDTKDPIHVVLKKGLTRFAVAFLKMFIDYGPPYVNNGQDINLCLECSNPQVKILLVHSMLNSHCKPDTADPDDLYNTPMHWCARNGHLLAMRMVRRAGAGVNPMNELGQTPLGLCVLMQFPFGSEERERQIKMAKWLVMQGADINIRDRGGYCAIDYCAMNQDEILAELLVDPMKVLLRDDPKIERKLKFPISKGAELLRNNYHIIAKRQPILKHVYKEKPYAVIYEKYTEQKAADEAERAIQRKKDEERAHDLRIEKLRKALDLKTEQRLAKIERLKEERKEQVMKEIKKEREAAEIAEEGKQLAQMRAERGKWVRKEENKHEWKFKDFQVGDDALPSREQLVLDCRSDINRLRDRNAKISYNARWKILTNGSEIEVDWKKQDPFLLEEDRRRLELEALEATRLQREKEKEKEDMEGLMDDLVGNDGFGGSGVGVRNDNASVISALTGFESLSVVSGTSIKSVGAKKKS